MSVKFEKLQQLAKNKTMYMISKDTGIAQSTLSDWKHGKTEPKLDKLMVLARYFNVDVTYFIDDNERS